jgi:hypothetical protein
MESLAAEVMPGATNALLLFWSPDAASIAFLSDGKLKKLPAAGGSAQTLADATLAGGGGDWNRNGVILFMPNIGPLYRVEEDGGEAIPVTKLDEVRGDVYHAYPQFLPDGRRFIFYLASTQRENQGIYAGSLDTDETSMLLPSDSQAAFAQPGYLFYVQNGNLLADSFDAERLTLGRAPSLVAPGIGANIRIGHAGFSISDSGVLAYRQASRSELVWLDSAGNEIESVGAGRSPWVIPGSTQVVAERNDPSQGGQTDIFLIDTDRGINSRFTFDPSSDQYPIAFSDGTEIIFTSRRTGYDDLYVKTATGKGEGEILLASEESKHATDWSADGRYVLYTDLILVNGRIFTIDGNQPRAEAFAVKNGRFIAVGSSDAIWGLAGPNTEVIDAEGMTVTPGFIDAHSNPSGAGVSELINVNVDLRSISEIEGSTPGPRLDNAGGSMDRWVQIRRHETSRRPSAGTNRPRPSRAGKLRHGATPGWPYRCLQQPGIRTGRRDGRDTGSRWRCFLPEKWRTDREGRRTRTKRILRVDTAGSTREQRQAGVRLISEIMSRSGLTSVHQTGGSTNDLIAYRDAHHAGELRFRTYLFLRGSLYRNLKETGVRTGFGDEWLRIGAVKYGADGSASERTMRMSTPYVGRPDDYGFLTMSQEEIHEAVEDGHRNGWQIGIHANGDVTIDMVLNAYERVQRMWPRDDPRHRIEHCSLVNPGLLERIRDLGVIPAPFYTYTHYHGNKWVEYGPEKMRWMFTHRSFLDYGIPVAPASNYTPGPLRAVDGDSEHGDAKGF